MHNGDTLRVHKEAYVLPRAALMLMLMLLYVRLDTLPEHD
jgi:hypothetical protein